MQLEPNEKDKELYGVGTDWGSGEDYDYLKVIFKPAFASDTFLFNVVMHKMTLVQESASQTTEQQAHGPHFKKACSFYHM